MNHTSLRFTVGARLLIAAALGLTVLLLGRATPAQAQVGVTFIVTTTADNTADDGACSLREAMLAANHPLPGLVNDDCGTTVSTGTVIDRIRFNIPGSGVKVINLTSALPQIWDAVNIMGPGSINDPPTIRVDGGNAVEIGFYVAPNFDESVSISGLIITRFTDKGIYISNGTNNVIYRNYIGTDGQNALPNRTGVHVSLSAQTTVGFAPNLISGNTEWGVVIANGVSNVLIFNNDIGFASDGSPLPNGSGGIYILNGTAQLIANRIGNHDGAYDKGIWLWTGSIISPSYNNCLGNNFYGLLNESGATANFVDNWWGHPTGPLSATGFGDRVTGPVTYSPFLTTQGSCPDTTLNILLNGSMEADGDANLIPDNWSQMNLSTPTDSRECYVGTVVLGNCSVRLVGTNTDKRLYQNRFINGVAGDVFLITGSSHAINVPVAGMYRLRLTIVYTDGTTGAVFHDFAIGTHTWEHVTLPFVAAKPYNQVQVLMRYTKASGEARFDNLGVKIYPMP